MGGTVPTSGPDGTLGGATGGCPSCCRNCYQNCYPSGPAAPGAPTPKGPPPASLQVTGPSTRGGWGIRTPEGFHPTRFPNALEGSRVGVGGGVCAGQGAARIGADRRGGFGLRANCYRNCYRSRWGGGAAREVSIRAIRQWAGSCCAQAVGIGAQQLRS